MAEDVTFANQQAIVKFTLMDSKGAALPANPTALSLTAGSTFIRLDDIPQATYMANGDGVLYVAIPAISGEAIELVASYEGSIYSYVRESVSFDNGKYYSISVKMKRKTTSYLEATAADVGKVIAANGEMYAKASDATAAGTTAVAVIAYVGERGSVDAGSSTFRGLAVSLSDAKDESVTNLNYSEYQWYAGSDLLECLAPASDYVAGIADLNGIHNTETLTGRKVSDKSGTAERCDADHNHPAALVATTANGMVAPPGSSGWFLPSLGQWSLILQGLADNTEALSDYTTTYNQNTVNAKIKSAGGTDITNSYWTSSLQKSGYAWKLTILRNVSSCSGVDTYNKSKVRPCVAF